MVEVVVTLRDAVMATLLAWGGVGDTQFATTDPSVRPPAVEAPATDKMREHGAKPEASVRKVTCQA